MWPKLISLSLCQGFVSEVLSRSIQYFGWSLSRIGIWVSKLLSFGFFGDSWFVIYTLFLSSSNHFLACPWAMSPISTFYYCWLFSWSARSLMGEAHSLLTIEDDDNHYFSFLSFSFGKQTSDSGNRYLILYLSTHLFSRFLINLIHALEKNRRRANQICLFLSFA